jgi:hypothetical protein
MSSFGSRTLGVGLAVALMAGCGGTQQVTGALPQGVVTKPPTAHWTTGKSWMLSDAKGDDLLYTSDDVGHVYVYSYPALRLVGQLGGFGSVATQGLCVDGQANIFVPTGVSSVSGYVYEFSHGGLSPIATLDDPGWGAGCSVDPTTGNLAVANYFSPNDEPYYHGDIAIYAGAQGTPRIYTSPYVNWYWWAAYDDKGDLFVDGNGYGASGFPLAELPAGGGAFKDISLDRSFAPYSLQWNKGNLIIASGGDSDDALSIYQVKVSGARGRIVKTTSLRTRSLGYDGNGQFWIHDRKVIGPGRNHNVLDLWRYPSGGFVRRRLVKHFSPWGVVISVAPSQK